jgi:hypothetical protein
LRLLFEPEVLHIDHVGSGCGGEGNAKENWHERKSR